VSTFRRFFAGVLLVVCVSSMSVAASPRDDADPGRRTTAIQRIVKMIKRLLPSSNDDLGIPPPKP